MMMPKTQTKRLVDVDATDLSAVNEVPKIALIVDLVPPDRKRTKTALLAADAVAVGTITSQTSSPPKKARGEGASEACSPQAKPARLALLPSLRMSRPGKTQSSVCQ